jgi:hypothetical protein
LPGQDLIDLPNIETDLPLTATTCNDKSMGLPDFVATYDLDMTGNERPSALFREVGTSYAAPVVSGFISLWLSHNPNKQRSDFAN